jgi:hypothetical protein
MDDKRVEADRTVYNLVVKSRQNLEISSYKKISKRYQKTVSRM